jgi:hypothetical protein
MLPPLEGGVVVESGAVVGVFGAALGDVVSGVVDGVLGVTSGDVPG